MARALESLNIGIIGVNRGLAFQAGLESAPPVRVRAVCAHRPGQRARILERFGPVSVYTDYEAMLERGGLDAVLIATPAPCHAPQALEALRRGLHVISEVPACVSIEEARALAAACRSGPGRYMLAANGNYLLETVLVRAMVRAGLFGAPYYAEGEHIHNLRALAADTPWRRHCLLGVNGVTYGTHPLGPILSWLPGDRVTEVCCSGSGRHYRDEAGACYENEDTCLMLCRTAGGALIKIRADLQSARPRATTNYALQGTEGAYESSRLDDGRGRVWLRSRCAGEQAWADLAYFEPEFLPPLYRLGRECAQGCPDRGCTFYTAAVCAEILTGRRPNELDVDTALDMTLPGLASQQSIGEGGRWIAVPDSRTWPAPRAGPTQGTP